MATWSGLSNDAALLAFQRREFDRWGEVVRQTGMKAEG